MDVGRSRPYSTSSDRDHSSWIVIYYWQSYNSTSVYTLKKCPPPYTLQQGQDLEQERMNSTIGMFLFNSKRCDIWLTLLLTRARPSYPASAISYIRQGVKSTLPLNIVEWVVFFFHFTYILYMATYYRRIGSGTGIFTRALLAHPDWSSSVGQLKAFEPSEGMRDVFVKAVKDDRVTIAEGTFDHTDVEDCWADIVVIAQVCRG